ncbi:MAG TPA: hypothetical protein VMU31_04745 [Rhizomicrobium sp.]|nr:hypothetical protein [Rhizomicrobium sp.]
MAGRKFQNGNICRAGGAALSLFLAGTPAFAQDSSLTLDPYQTDLGEAQLSLGGVAGGSVFDGNLKGQPAASGVVKAMPRLYRDYDSGLVLGLDATLAASDPLSRGRYDGDFFEKLYGEARTGLGRVEIGLTDGGAYDVAVTGPKVDAQVSLDNPQTTFFRDPSSHHAVSDVFTLRTEVGASSNYAKIAYVSPALFGAQLALSFTPSQSRDVVPFLHQGPDVPDRQSDMWEAGLRYSDDFGPVTLTGYGGVTEGEGERKLPGQEGVSDLGAGLRADYAVNDDWMLSLGGSYRQSNAYAFDITHSEQAGTTHATFVSAGATYGQWVAGLEYGNGNAGSAAGLPQLGLNGYQASLGYVLNRNWQITGGWQRLDYARSVGLFFNGATHLNMDAAFLHLSLHV